MSQARLADVRSLQGGPVGIGPNDQIVLKSRVEQQSELIMMLKTHNDNMATEMRELERSRGAARESAVSADNDRAELARRLAELDDRFQQLASNHEETVTFMEGHKADKERLSSRVSNLEGSLSKSADAAAAVLVAKHEAELKAAHAAKKAAETKAMAAETKAMTAEERALQSEQMVASKDAAHAAAEKRTADMEAKHKEALAQAEAVARAAELHKATIVQLEQKVAAAASELDRSKSELEVALAAARSGTSEVSAIAKERDAHKAEVEELQKKLLEGSDGELGKVKKEYHAYKRYSTQLLQKEKEVNARLRHLGGQ
eukprot:m.30268 g.30268  ORF g.30268 m.30268 type:complete len:317 (-) comp12211_c0_seq1:121-1071(-)